MPEPSGRHLTDGAAALRRPSAGVCFQTLLALLGALFGGPTSTADGAEFALRGELVGAPQTVIVAAGDSLIELARRFDLGYNEITAANPGVDPFLPPPGAVVALPTLWILPEVPRAEGLVVNLAERRLFRFRPPGVERVETYPIGVGDEGWDTPKGTFRVVGKSVAPTWRVPASIRRQRPELPAFVPPGPENPLGTHALRLSAPGVLIHGTNRAFGVGRRVSHGCIRLYPEDIKVLFPRVGLGTTVTIVDQPIKVAVAQNRILLEVHGEEEADLEAAALWLVSSRGLLGVADPAKVRQAAREKRGVPFDVTSGPPSEQDPLPTEAEGGAGADLRTPPRASPSDRSTR